MALSVCVFWGTVVVMTTCFLDTEAMTFLSKAEIRRRPGRQGNPNVVTLDIVNDREVRVQCPPSFRECVNKYSSSPMSTDNINLWCLRTTLRQMPNGTADPAPWSTPAPSQNTGSGRFEGIRSMLQRLQRDGLERPPSGRRATRQEYRTLSVAQRDRFHRALQVLYEDGIMEEMVGIHSDAFQSRGAHRGVAFLPWHRFFISIFEQALIQVDSQVTLPYWDSTIDNNMGASAWRSVMWDDAHLGAPAGAVDSGPFTGWTAVDGDLVRDVAGPAGGSPFSQDRLEDMLEECRLQEYSSGIEDSHNGVHMWVGGTMARASGPSDPVFYMVHAFVDLQWERFREHQRADCNIDPSTDYPTTNDPPHGPNELMDGWDPSLAFPNRDGIRDSWTQNWFTYADPPSCSNNCGNSPDMSCDSGSNLCVGREIGASRRRRKREAMAAIRSVEGKRKPRSTRHCIRRHGSCTWDPYSSSCPKPDVHATYQGVAEAMLCNKLPIPNRIKQLLSLLREYRR